MKEWIREKLQPLEVPPKEERVPEPTPVPAQPSPGIALTAADLQAIIATAVATAIQESKRLSPEEQEAADEAKRRKQEARVSRVKEALQDQRVEREKQFYCSHIKFAEGVYKQEHAFRGQVSNNNTCSAICIRCHKKFPPYKVTDENLKSGMALQNHSRLSAAALYEMHRRSFPDCKECAKGLCAVRDQRELKQGYLDADPEIMPTGKVRVQDLAAV